MLGIGNHILTFDDSSDQSVLGHKPNFEGHVAWKVPTEADLFVTYLQPNLYLEATIV